MPTATVMEARLRIFQPTLHPKSIDEVIKNKYGTVGVTGKLGQRHLGLLQQIRLHAIKWVAMPTGGLKILVDPYQLRKGLTGGDGVYSQEGMRRLLDDLTGAMVEVDTSNFHSSGHIIDNASEAKATAYNPLTKADRPLMRIDLGSVALTFLDKDISLYYDPTPINSLRYGISQGVAHWVLSMEDEPNRGWKVDEVIKAVSGPLRGDTLRTRRHELRADATGLIAVGIRIDGNLILRYDHVCHVCHALCCAETDESKKVSNASE
jgi:hypothetical protein